MRKPVGWVSACRATELGCCGSHLGEIGGQECLKQNPATDLATSQQSRKNELSHRCVLDTLLFMSACTAWLGWVVAGGWWWVSLCTRIQKTRQRCRQRPPAGQLLPCHFPANPLHCDLTTDSAPTQSTWTAASQSPPIPANHHVLIRCNPGQVCRLLRFTQPGHDAVAWFNPMSLTLHT